MGKQIKLLTSEQGGHSKRPLVLILPLVLVVALTACVYPSVPTKLLEGAEAVPQESLLPLLEREEDVLKTLGIWEDASILQAEGLSLQEAVEKLGFGPEKMRRELNEIGEKAFNRYNRQTERLVKSVFGEDEELIIGRVPSEDIIPPLKSAEDVFKALSVWEDALFLLEQGLTPQDTAQELGFDSDSMFRQLIQASEDRVRRALFSGLVVDKLPKMSSKP